MYAKTYLLAAVPALVVAQSADPVTVSSLSSLYAAEGYNSVAASYLAAQQARPDIFSQVDQWNENSAVAGFQMTADALTQANPGPAINSALVASYLTYISDTSARAQISSILVQANSLQANPAAAPAQASATATGSAAGGSTAAAGASSGAASGSGAAPAPTGSMATSAKPTGSASGSPSGSASSSASAANASHSNAAMPRQTGLVMAAGVAAGVIGAVAAF